MSHGKCEKFVDPSATVGEDCTIWHYAIVLQLVTIGKCCSIGSRCEVGRGTTIGDYSRIGSGTFLPANTKIGRYVFIGPNVTMTDDRYPRVPVPGDPKYDARPPVIEDGASIGAGAVILPGIHIGLGARVAAGAIVTHDVPSNGVVRSQPARPHQPSSSARRAGFGAGTPLVGPDTPLAEAGVTLVAEPEGMR